MVKEQKQSALPIWARRLSTGSELLLTERHVGPSCTGDLLGIFQQRKSCGVVKQNLRQIGQFYAPNDVSAQEHFIASLREISKNVLRSEKARHILPFSEIEKLSSSYKSKSFNFHTGGGSMVAKKDTSPLPISIIENCVSYTTFRELGYKMSKGAEKFFLPSTFLKCRRSSHGNVDYILFCEYVENSSDMRSERGLFSMFDTNNDGFLSEANIENFFLRFLQTVPLLQKLPEEFHMFYVFTASRKVFFFLDPGGQQKVSIKDVLTSSLYREMKELQVIGGNADAQIERNWFVK